MVDHSTMQMLLAAQNAGSGQAGIYSLIAPAAVAGMFFIGVIACSSNKHMPHKLPVPIPQYNYHK